MAKQRDNGHVPGTFVSNTELQELNTLLTTFRDYILSHEARLELVENWITEFTESNFITEEVGEVTFHPEEAVQDSADVAAEIDEPTDDPEEG